MKAVLYQKCFTFPNSKSGTTYAVISLGNNLIGAITVGWQGSEEVTNKVAEFVTDAINEKESRNEKNR